MTRVLHGRCGARLDPELGEYPLQMFLDGASAGTENLRDIPVCFAGADPVKYLSLACREVKRGRSICGFECR